MDGGRQRLGRTRPARACARIASPLPIVRARGLSIAAERLRALRPVAVVIAADVPPADADALLREAGERAATVVRLEAHGDDPAPLRLALGR